MVGAMGVFFAGPPQDDLPSDAVLRMQGVASFSASDASFISPGQRHFSGESRGWTFGDMGWSPNATKGFYKAPFLLPAIEPRGLHSFCSRSSAGLGARQDAFYVFGGVGHAVTVEFREMRKPFAPRYSAFIRPTAVHRQR